MTEISRLEGVSRQSDRKTRLLPVPAGGGERSREAGGAMSQQRTSARPSGSASVWRHRNSTAFLAQLSLQYDDVSAARIARRERQQAAAKAYDGGMRRHRPAARTTNVRA